MIAVEFQALVKDGTIEVPAQYCEQLSGLVRVIVLRSEQPKQSKIIERLLREPIQDPTCGAGQSAHTGTNPGDPALTRPAGPGARPA